MGPNLYDCLKRYNLLNVYVSPSNVYRDWAYKRLVPITRWEHHNMNLHIIPVYMHCMVTTTCHYHDDDDVPLCCIELHILLCVSFLVCSCFVCSCIVFHSFWRLVLTCFSIVQLEEIFRAHTSPLKLSYRESF